MLPGNRVRIWFQHYIQLPVNMSLGPPFGLFWQLPASSILVLENTRHDSPWKKIRLSESLSKICFGSLVGHGFSIHVYQCCFFPHPCISNFPNHVYEVQMHCPQFHLQSDSLLQSREEGGGHKLPLEATVTSRQEPFIQAAAGLLRIRG